MRRVGSVLLALLRCRIPLVLDQHDLAHSILDQLMSWSPDITKCVIMSHQRAGIRRRRQRILIKISEYQLLMKEFPVTVTVSKLVGNPAEP